MDLRRLSDRIRRRLESEYGRPENDRDEEPLSALVRTILSQNTTDLTSERAWKALKERYPSWEALRDADIDELSEVIRVGGLPRLKAERILGALHEIERSTGRLSLDLLKEMSRAAADDWLRRLKGVGPKTRAIVLLFSLGKDAFPVDTHIFRVTKRLGLVPSSASREEAQELMAKLSRPKDYFSYHVNLIEHGRRVCRAARPKCGTCFLNELCGWEEKERYAMRLSMASGRER